VWIFSGSRERKSRHQFQWWTPSFIGAELRVVNYRPLSSRPGRGAQTVLTIRFHGSEKTTISVPTAGKNSPAPARVL
jgi:hypothetical protein